MIDNGYMTRNHRNTYIIYYFFESTMIKSNKSRGQTDIYRDFGFFRRLLFLNMT